MKKTNFYSLRALGLVALFLTFSLSGAIANAAPATGPTSFTILPPVDFIHRDTNGQPSVCGTQNGGLNGGILAWEGSGSQNPINCSPMFYGDPTSGNVYQTGKVQLDQGLYINGANANLGDQGSKVIWASLPNEGECAGGGNVGVDVSGGLHCCPYGRVVTAASLNAVTCGTLQ